MLPTYPRVPAYNPVQAIFSCLDDNIDIHRAYAIHGMSFKFFLNVCDGISWFLGQNPEAGCHLEGSTWYLDLQASRPVRMLLNFIPGMFVPVSTLWCPLFFPATSL